MHRKHKGLRIICRYSIKIKVSFWKKKLFLAFKCNNIGDNNKILSFFPGDQGVENKHCFANASKMSSPLNAKL